MLVLLSSDEALEEMPPQKGLLSQLLGEKNEGTLGLDLIGGIAMTRFAIDFIYSRSL